MLKVKNSPISNLTVGEHDLQLHQPSENNAINKGGSSQVKLKWGSVERSVKSCLLK